MVTGNEGNGKWRVTANGYGVSLGSENVQRSRQLRNSVNMLKTADLYPLNGELYGELYGM